MRRHPVFSGVLLAAVLAVVGIVPSPAGAVSESSHWSAAGRFAPRTWDTPTALSCATMSSCTGVVEGDAFSYDGTRWSGPRSAATDHGPLQSVSCPTSDFCAAVGGRTTVIERNRTWQGIGFAPFELTSVSCPTRAWCMGVGSAGKTWVWSGRWHRGPRAGSSRLWGVSCTSRHFCMAVSSHQRAFRFTGRAWHAAGRTGRYLASLSCGSPSSCMQTGVGTAQHWNGRRWGPRRTDGDDGPSTVSCAGSHFCVLVTQTGRASTWRDGWGPLEDVAGLAQPPGSYPPVLSCPRPGRCVAAPSGAAVTSLVYAGTWRTGASFPVSPPGRYFPGVSCPTSSFCMALDGAGRASRYVDGSWHATPFPSDQVSAAGFSCASSLACVAVGQDGQTSSWDGTTWSETQSVGITGDSWAVDCAAASFCVAVGTDDADVPDVRAFSWDGSGWTAIAAPIEAGSSVQCPAVDDCWDGTAYGDVTHYDGTTWSPPVRIVRQHDYEGFSPLVLSCVSTGFCMAYDAFRNVYVKRPGGAWSAPHRLAAISSSPQALSCGSATSCTLVLRGGRVARWRHGRWLVTEVLPSHVTLSGVSCAGSRFCLAVHRSGRSWRRS